MQKKLIALALASLAGSAFAQSNVTIYGVADLGQAWVKSSGGAVDNQKNVGRLDSNSSYIGFKGVEDLGNGLKAVFQFETGVAADNAGGSDGVFKAAGRDTFVGLAGSFGTVAAGTLTHPLRAMGAKVELMPGAAGFGTTAAVTGTVLGMKTGADDRAQNAIAYISPSFSGFTGVLAYVNGESNTDGGANVRQYQVAGQYENGPLFVGLGYHRAVDVATDVTLGANGAVTPASLAGNDGGKATVWRVAGTYTFPTNTKLTALWDSTKADATGLVSEAKRNAWSLGVAQGFGKNTIGVEYARAGKVKADGDSVDGTTVKMWSAVYTYELSKRTTAHVRYSKLDNGDLAAANFYLNPVSNGGGVSAGGNVSGFMAGIRHAF